MSRLKEILKYIFFHVEEETNWFIFIGRVVLLLGILGWTFILAGFPIDGSKASFMNNVNLVFHEAGHYIFSGFGEFICSLGGTIMQLLVPFIVFLAFLLKNQDAYAASIALWWLGENFREIAVYINDATIGKLVLLGGVTAREVPGYHDWQNILGTLGWLQYDHLLASVSSNFGKGLMFLSIIWGGYILYLQSKNLSKIASSQ